MQRFQHRRISFGQMLIVSGFSSHISNHLRDHTLGQFSFFYTTKWPQRFDPSIRRKLH